MKAKKVEDQDLVQAFIKGDPSAIEVLINRHRNKVYTYILLTIKNQQLAEDLFQETFIKVIQSLRSGKYRDDGRFLSWVIRIAHNLIIDHFRKEKQMNSISNDENNIDLFNSRKLADQNIEERIVENQIRSELRELINALPEDQREVVLLRHYGELSFKEIADQTEVSINTALGRMRYALINLRKMIKEKEISLTLQ
ncbi:MAG: sigma-70 family RNA polymerase sigma factor [Bacteroidales bacterium]|nr:sigma-70 family RNA polymerase sigma factor [Bacteroidales bacterium]MBN2697274.1 sigma-70 family RNA polymerase sigma factor [Bacteroidales bacterium]